MRNKRVNLSFGTRLLVVILLLSGLCRNASAQENRGSQKVDGVVEIVDARGNVVGQFKEAHALVIGESEYTNTSAWRLLPGVKEDVAAVKELFIEQGFNVETIENANSNNLKSGITNFLDKYGYNPDARIVIYFAGHGATRDLDGRKMGYIVPVDAPPASNSSDFLKTVIPMTQFETWAKQYTSRHILFVFDSCFAGSVFRSQDSTPPAINRLISQSVRQFITSGGADETVDDDSKFRKEFVYALRNGLADNNKDGYVTGTELGLYLYNQVSNYTNGGQNPRVEKIRDTDLNKGDFVFFVNNSQDGSSPTVVITSNTQPNQNSSAGNDGGKSAPSGQTYKIGDTGPAGGIVFYDKGVFSNNWRYLEAAPDETEVTAQWGAYIKNITGTNTVVGNGKKNTEIILEQLKKLNENRKAAQLCVAINFDGSNDWFLPNKDELNLMYKNLKQKGLGGFSNNWYWSSSQFSNSSAWVQNFSNGSQNNFGKNNTCSVRAIRAF